MQTGVNPFLVICLSLLQVPQAQSAKKTYHIVANARSKVSLYLDLHLILHIVF